MTCVSCGSEVRVLDTTCGECGADQPFSPSFDRSEVAPPPAPVIPAVPAAVPATEARPTVRRARSTRSTKALAIVAGVALVAAIGSASLVSRSVAGWRRTRQSCGTRPRR